MLEELEMVEKKHQLQIKERDRAFAEEKNKLVKKYENLLRSSQMQQEAL